MLLKPIVIVLEWKVLLIVIGTLIALAVVETYTYVGLVCMNDWIFPSLYMSNTSEIDAIILVPDYG